MEQLGWIVAFAIYVVLVALGGYGLTSARLTGLWRVLTLARAGLGLVFHLSMQNAGNWDGIGWMLLLFAVPVLWTAGLLPGGVVGLARPKV